MFTMETAKKMLRPDNTEQTFSAFSAKIIAGWAGWFAGLSLGDIATLAVITWTCLNIIFLLYDRLVKPFKKKNETHSPQETKE